MLGRERSLSQDDRNNEFRGKSTAILDCTLHVTLYCRAFGHAEAARRLSRQQVRDCLSRVSGAIPGTLWFPQGVCVSRCITRASQKNGKNLKRGATEFPEKHTLLVANMEAWNDCLGELRSRLLAV